MQSSRDSSVWRSLAVAFGDGLAFGVGMKLTQNTGRTPPAAVPPADPNPMVHRLEQIEQRIAGIEQRPLALTAPEKGAAPAHPFDQKVLEAVITALDARLHEQSGLVERQITELQAKITIELKTLHQQDRSIADGLQARIEEVQKHFIEQLAAIRQAGEAERRAVQEHFTALRREVAGMIAEHFQSSAAELQEQFGGQLNALRGAAEADRRASQQQLAALRDEIASVVAESSQAEVAWQQHLTAELSAIRNGEEAERQAMRDRLEAMRAELAGNSQSAAGLREQFTAEAEKIRKSGEADRQAMQQQITAARDQISLVAAGNSQAATELRDHLSRELDAIRKSGESDRAAVQSQIADLRRELSGALAETSASSAGLRDQLTAQVEALRQVNDASRQAMQQQISGMHHQMAAAVAAQLHEVQQQSRDELREAMGNMAATAASAADSTIEERIAPLRATIEAKDREIAQLRARLAGTDQATLDLLHGVGEICRRAAQRLESPPAIPPDPSAGSTPPSEAGGAPPVAIGPQSETESSAATEEVPGFAQPATPGKLWRVPLVSSLVLTTGAMLMMHYL